MPRAPLSNPERARPAGSTLWPAAPRQDVRGGRGADRGKLSQAPAARKLLATTCSDTARVHPAARGRLPCAPGPAHSRARVLPGSALRLRYGVCIQGAVQGGCILPLGPAGQARKPALTPALAPGARPRRRCEGNGGSSTPARGGSTGAGSPWRRRGQDGACAVARPGQAEWAAGGCEFTLALRLERALVLMV